jgi:hypothetical protein
MAVMGLSRGASEPQFRAARTFLSSGDVPGGEQPMHSDLTQPDLAAPVIAGHAKHHQDVGLLDPRGQLPSFDFRCRREAIDQGQCQSGCDRRDVIDRVAMRRYAPRRALCSERAHDLFRASVTSSWCWYLGASCSECCRSTDSPCQATGAGSNPSTDCGQRPPSWRELVGARP